jgi:rare lipoprotein A
MANGKKFNPDQLTAASWFYPLGTKVRVTAYARSGGSVRPVGSVVVRITDRGPAKHLVQDGRIIDLSHAAFKRLANPNQGLVQLKVRPEPPRTEKRSA